MLQLLIEWTIDICKLFVSGMRLGLPSEENDLFEKLLERAILSQEMVETLKRMRGFRNVLVHEYAAVDGHLVYLLLTKQLEDFRKFKGEVLWAIS